MESPDGAGMPPGTRFPGVRPNQVFQEGQDKDKKVAVELAQERAALAMTGAGLDLTLSLTRLE